MPVYEYERKGYNLHSSYDMALPKKKSRIINIDGNQYRWLVGPNDGYNVFVAEKEGVAGQKIEVYFDTEIDKYWTEFPNISGLNLKILKPKDAAFIIRQALEQGWEPEKKGSPVVFDWKNDIVTKRPK